MKNKTELLKARTKKADLGYTNVRITKKAYRELTRVAIANKRTLIAQLEVLLGI